MAQQSLWEATKWEAQSAFKDIGNSYQQILVTGHLYPPIDRDQLNREIAEDSWKRPEPEPEELFYKNHFHSHEPEPPEPAGIEPER